MTMKLRAKKPKPPSPPCARFPAPTRAAAMTADVAASNTLLVARDGVNLYSVGPPSHGGWSPV